MVKARTRARHAVCAGSWWSGWRVPPALGWAGPAGQLFGADDVGVARVGRQRLWPHAGGAVALADLDLPHRKPLLLVRAAVALACVRVRIWRRPARRRHRLGGRRPRHPGERGGHPRGRRPVRRDALAGGEQRAGVLEQHDAVAEQAPSLLGVRGHDMGRLAIYRVRGRTRRLMLAHHVPPRFLLGAPAAVRDPGSCRALPSRLPLSPAGPHRARAVFPGRCGRRLVRLCGPVVLMV